MSATSTFRTLRNGRGAWRLLAVAAVAASTVVASLGGPASAAVKKPKPKVDPYLKADVQAPGATLTGAGSTFDQPFFTSAFYQFNKIDSGVTVNYASIGSGGGIAQFQANTVNFGASDVPMSSADIALAKGGEVLQVPVDLGVAISYNVPGVKTALKLTPLVLSDIFLGVITTWNNPAIKKLNPKVKLPSNNIVTVHRADGSGTTYIFTNYLTDISPAWRSGPGVSKSVSWPNGVAGQGNEGVAGIIQDTPYTIGYVELAYARLNHFTFAAIKNQAGNFVTPSKTTVAAAAAAKKHVTYVDFSIVNEPGKQSYPISGYSWALIYQLQTNLTNGTAMVKMLDWLTHAPGQAIANAIGYVTMPANVQALSRSTLLQVTGPNGRTPLLSS